MGRIDAMNKVIEEIKEFIISLSGGPESAIEEMAEDFYDRIAREFPEDEFDRLLLQAMDDAAKNPLTASSIEWAKQFKHLWEGPSLHQKIVASIPDEIRREVREKGGPMICRKCGHSAYSSVDQMDCDHDYPVFDKGGCPTCGGSRSVHSCKALGGFMPGKSCGSPVCNEAYNEPCSDCGGTGERRVGEWRKGKEKYQESFILQQRFFSFNKSPWEVDNRKAERRNRRQGKVRRISVERREEAQ